jgi:hypothetical protein
MLTQEKGGDGEKTPNKGLREKSYVELTKSVRLAHRPFGTAQGKQECLYHGGGYKSRRLVWLQFGGTGR